MPTITLNELSHYNNGILLTKEFDLENYSDASDYGSAVEEWLESIPAAGTELDEDGVPEQPCEEYYVGDTDDLNEIFTKYESFDAESYYAWCDLEAEAKIAFEYLAEVYYTGADQALENAENIYVHSGVSLEEYAEEFFNECYDIPEYLKHYIDYASVARDMEINGEIAYYDKYNATISGLNCV